MRITRLVILAATIFFAGQAVAERRTVDETRAASANGFVHINLVRGDLSVAGWDREEIRVSGKLDEEVREFVFEVDGNDATIQVKIPQSFNSGWGDSASDLDISLPRGSNVDVSVVSTDVDVRDIDGGLTVGGVSGDLTVVNIGNRTDLRTVSGDIELRDTAGRIRVSTVNGDMDSYGTRGQSVYHTVSGDLMIDNGAQDLELESVSGDMEVIDTEFLSIRGHSVSGDAEFAGRMLAGGVVEFDSVSGTVRLSTGGDVNARFDLETASGSIRNRLTSDKPSSSEYVRNEHLRFVTGDGKGEVIVSTRSGDIILKR